MNRTRINIGGQCLDLATPAVMGILNVTPDSFYAASRVAEDEVVERAAAMLASGAAVLDIGGCSTRPQSQPVDGEEEWRRVEPALRAVREAFPAAVLSLDTFRVEVARRALESFGALIINDISGGGEAMYDLVQRTGVPYVLTGRELPERMRSYPGLICDPGIGFLGSTEADYRALREMKRGDYPLLVGVSRKSMIYKPLGITPAEALAPTQAMHMYALMHGADILRVHDVKEAAETVKMFTMLEK